MMRYAIHELTKPQSYCGDTIPLDTFTSKWVHPLSRGLVNVQKQRNQEPFQESIEAFLVLSVWRVQYQELDHEAAFA